MQIIKQICKKIVIYILFLESKIVLFVKKPEILCIVGSVGKTTTKDVLVSVLSEKLDLRGNKKTYNGDIGVPLTILGLDNEWDSPLGWLKNIIKGCAVPFQRNYPKFLILEIGIDHPGEMKKIAKLLKPKYIIFTWFPKHPVHAKFFQNTEHLYEEKFLIIDYMKKDGIVILNSMDEIQTNHKKIKSLNKVHWYLPKNFKYKILYKENKPKGISIYTNNDKSTITVMGIIGKQIIYPFAAAYKLLEILHINFPQNIKYTPAPGRLRIFDGINGSTIIDDSYNSSPFATKKSLETLNELKCMGKKIAILGHMSELAFDQEEEAHIETVKIAMSVTDHIYLVGQLYKKISQQNNIKWFVDSNDIFDYIKDDINKNDLILVKGSQSTRMEKVVTRLVHTSIDKKTNLARQEKIWDNK